MDPNILVVLSVLAIFETAFSTRIHRVLASPDIPITSFSCEDRPIGYYADVETNCQVYHMCGEGGRQYTYTCPNTTLFHQRMLICAHWYQVNCNRSMADYSANLLIGQRDKPFVDDYITSNLGEELQYIEGYKNSRNAKALNSPRKSIENRLDKKRLISSDTTPSGSLSLENADISDLDRAQTGSVISSHMFGSSNRLISGHKVQHGSKYKGAVAVKPTSVTEPTGAAQFRPTNVSFRSTIETPNSESVLARTAPMTSSQPAHRTESAFKQSESITPSNLNLEGRPSRELLPPLIPDLLEHTNTIELRLEDPRRALYIPRADDSNNGRQSQNEKQRLLEDKPIVVTINLRGQTGFRSTAVDKQKLTQCNRCHPVFLIDKKNCTPCLLIT